MQPHKTHKKMPKTPPKPQQTKSIQNILKKIICKPRKYATNPYVDKPNNQFEKYT